MTEPSQYFKGRTVQEQMDEVIGYVDKRAEEVAAAKADDVLQPAEDAKTAAQAAAQQAEAAKDTTLAALPEIRQDISGLKAEDTALDGRLDTVELKVQTAEGNIVTIQGRITAIENKNTQQDSAISALQTADGQNVKINNINQYAVGLTGNQPNIGGVKTFINGISAFPAGWHPTFTASGNIGDIKLFAKLKNQGPGKYIAMMFTQTSNTAACCGVLIVRNSSSDQTLGWVARGGFGPNNPLTADSIVIAGDGVNIYLGSRKKTTFGDLKSYVIYSNNYTNFDVNPSPQIEWLENEVNIGTGSGYTIVEASQ